MIRTFGLLNSYSPIKKLGENSYRISWDYTEVPNPIYAELTPEEQAKEEAGEFVERTIIGYNESTCGTWMTDIIYEKPTEVLAKRIILDWYNKDIDYKILSGFVWKNMPVWLSSENQFNYKAAYDLAVQTNGESLPVTFKFGTSDNPIYYTFETLEDFTDFYTSAINYINQTLAEGW
jgi:hypothetical protein